VMPSSMADSWTCRRRTAGTGEAARRLREVVMAVTGPDLSGSDVGPVAAM
jgi:hypothetical protein